MPHRQDRTLRKAITRMAFVIAGAAVLVVPAIYFYTAYRYEVENLESVARNDAGALSIIAFRYQRMWSFQEPRIEALLSRGPSVGPAMAKRVLDAQGEIAAEIATRVPAPVLQRSAPVMIGGRTVGLVEVTQSMRPLLFGTALAALAGLLLGIAMFVVLRNLPLRALSRSMKELSEANHEIRTLNESLQSKVLARTAELRKSEARFRDLIEGSIEGIVIDRMGEPLFANQAYADMFGYADTDEILGLDSLSALYPAVERKRIEGYRSARLRGHDAPKEYDFQGVRKDGSTIWLTNMARVVSWDGEDAVQSTLIDITARKRAEDELAENAERLAESNRALMLARHRLEDRTRDLEVANEELSQYAHVVSHDLKAPLRAIHNYSDFLAEDLGDSLVEEQKTYLEGMGRAVRQSEDLVEDLLSISRIGRQDAPAETVQLGDMLSELIEALKPDSDAEIRIAEDWPSVEVSSPLMRQVFQNLMTNALKFNVSDCKTLDIGWREVQDGAYEIHLRDNGIGIESRFLEKIFVIFQRLHTAEEYEGTGIGLAIVKKAVVKMGCSVRVESTPGEGSTFFVTIPKCKQRHGR